MAKNNNFIFKTESTIMNNLTNINNFSDINNSEQINSKTDDLISLESCESTSLESCKSTSLESCKSTNLESFNVEFNTEYNSEYQDKIYDKYIKNDKIKSIKFNDEIKNIEKQDYDFNISVLKNNLNELKKNINTNMYLFRNDKEHIIKICSNKNCVKLNCSNECYKNDLYKSFWNFNRGIKTTYNLLFKILLSCQIFRIQCKCCENGVYTNYFNELDKKFASKQKVSTIFENLTNNFEPIKTLELNINFLINKFMGTIGILDCECKFKNKYHSFYTFEYLNYSNIIKIYVKTIPLAIKLLKIYFEIKDNHEELELIDDTRCIHEDIRYNNLTYCLKKKYNTMNKKYLTEIVMKLDLINSWIIDSIKITNILLNQQSLEYFIFYLENKPNKLINNFNKIYNLNNNFLDLNYISNKNSIIKIINLNYNKLIVDDIDKLYLLIYKQLMNRNKHISNYDVNTIIINYIYETINYKNIKIAFKWLEYIKNIQKTNLNEQTKFELEKIFNSLLDNSIIDVNTKISYLKIINKNQINIIEYDFVNKLIDLKIGDNIILEFDKDENTLFNIGDYKNEQYIKEIIKKCIIKNKPNILDYILFKLNNSIKNYSIDVISIYLLNIKHNEKFHEFEYIDLLKIIIKYFTKTNIKTILNMDENYTSIEYCIKNNFYLSANIFIKNNIDVNISNKKNFNSLLNCFENSNTIIFEYLLNNNPEVIIDFYDGLNLITYLFIYWEKKIIKESNILFIFLYKIFYLIHSTNIGTNLINHQDELNELVGFKILNFNEFNSKEKTLLFKIIIDIINPLEIDNFKQNSSETTLNYPLIIHSMLIDELEITFILLNNLLKNGSIKKNINNDVSRIFDYYLLNTTININFIPIIFKYIKDNRDKCNKFEEKKLQYNLNGINNMIILLFESIKLVLFFIAIKLNKCIQNNVEISNINDVVCLDNEYLNRKNSNGYVEINISSDTNPNQLYTSTNINPNQNTNTIEYLNKHKFKIFKEEINENNLNKNIWVSSTKTTSDIKNNNKLSSDSINLSETNSSNSSNISNISNIKNNINNLYKTGINNQFEISESNVLFDYN